MGKYAIYGAGSLGTVLGAYITKNGGTVELINRNRAHVAALNEKGATITGTVNMTVPVKAITPDEMQGEYDVIFVDPPYQIGLADRALKQIGSHPVLAKNGVVVLECSREETKAEEEGNLILRRRYDYGTVSVLIYVRKDRED